MNTKTDISSQVCNLAAVSYIPLMGLIVLYGHWQDIFIRLHALQGTILSLGLLAVYFIPEWGVYLALFLAGICAGGFLQAVHGHRYLVPVLGQILSLFCREK